MCRGSWDCQQECLFLLGGASPQKAAEEAFVSESSGEDALYKSRAT